MGRLRSVAKLCAGRHFDWEILVLCVRWYLRYTLSLCDLVEMMADAACAHDPEMGPALRSGVREAMETFRMPSWQVLASR